MPTLREGIVSAVVEATRLAATRARRDLRGLLASAIAKETSAIARAQLEYIVMNVDIGARESLPYCQDTGTIHYYVRLGDGFPERSWITNGLELATKQATRDIPLRPNYVDPFTGTNFGTGAGGCSSLMSVELVDGDGLEVDVLLKGGGAENVSTLRMLSPADATVPGAIARLVRDAIIDAGGKPCPPVILGIGIGGSATACLAMAKKALLRELGKPAGDEPARVLEREIMAEVNATGLGTMGLGGDVTCLAVHVESCPRHPASYPVGIVVQCWAHRHATARIGPDGGWTVQDDF